MDPILLGCGACVLLLVMLVAYVFFLLTMSRAIALCSRRNRAMEPGLVWLGLIPIFHALWLFFIVIKVAGSLRNEFEDRRMRGGSYGQPLGLTSCVLYLVSFVFNLVGRLNDDFNTFVALPFGIFVLCCWIVYWIQIAGYNRRLRSRPAYDDEDDYDDDYDDGRRRRGDEDDDDDDDDRRGRRRRRRRGDDDF